jgi:hypothetical protein
VGFLIGIDSASAVIDVETHGLGVLQEADNLEKIIRARIAASDRNPRRIVSLISPVPPPATITRR